MGERRSENQPPQLDGTPSDPHQPEALKALSVNVDHHFASSSYLRFLTFIYNAAFGAAGSNGGNAGSATAPNSAAADLAVQVQIFRDDQPVVTTPLHKVDSDGIADAKRVPYAADVPLSDLSPGAYVLQVTVIDKLAKASATRKLSFQIE